MVQRLEGLPQRFSGWMRMMVERLASTTEKRHWVAWQTGTETGAVWREWEVQTLEPWLLAMVEEQMWSQYLSVIVVVHEQNLRVAP